MVARTSITPPLEFNDTNWVPDGSWVNNARQISSQANVGSPCGITHDDAVQQTGPFTDAAATVSLVGPVSPGQVLYMRTSLTSIAPAPDFSRYAVTGFVDLPPNGLFDGNDPDRWFRGQGGDPAGLLFRDDDPSVNSGMTPFDTGVRCVAAGGGVSDRSGLVGRGSNWRQHRVAAGLDNILETGDPTSHACRVNTVVHYVLQGA
jgi:hypothetical protein